MEGKSCHWQKEFYDNLILSGTKIERREKEHRRSFTIT